MRILPIDGPTIRIVEYPRDLDVSGRLYKSLSGYDFTGYSSTADFAPGSLDIGGICDVAGVDRALIASGSFDGAWVYVFATNWDNAYQDDVEIFAGVLGKATIMDDRFTISCTSLVDLLKKKVGRTYTAKCQKPFCGTEYAGCGVILAANTVTGTLTSVESNFAVIDSARAEADDIFGAGRISFSTGLNAGLRALDIKAYSAAGRIEVFEPFYYLPAIGDQYEMVRGCRKRAVDCKERWNGTAIFSNIENFGGFEYIPTAAQYTYIGKTSVL